MRNVIDELRKQIDRSGLSRYAIAKATGIDQARLSRFMAGGKLTLEQADTICKLLKLQLKRRQ